MGGIEKEPGMVRVVTTHHGGADRSSNSIPMDVWLREREKETKPWRCPGCVLCRVDSL